MHFIRSPRVDCKTRAALGAYSAGIDVDSLETRATLGRGQRPDLIEFLGRIQQRNISPSEVTG